MTCSKRGAETSVLTKRRGIAGTKISSELELIQEGWTAAGFFQENHAGGTGAVKYGNILLESRSGVQSDV